MPIPAIPMPAPVGAAIGQGLAPAVTAAAATQAGAAVGAAGAKRSFPNVEFRDGAFVVPGQPPMNKEAFLRLLENSKNTGQFDMDQINGLTNLANSGASLAGMRFENGRLTDRFRQPTTFEAAASGSQTGGGASTAPSGGGGRTFSGGGGGGGSAGGGGGGRVSGSTGNSVPNYNAGAGGGPVDGNRPRIEETTGSGSNGPGPATINPRAPLGIPAINPANPGGSSYFSGGATPFPGAFNPFAGLGPNSSLNDVIAGVAGAQVGNRNAALSTLGGVFNESQGGVSAQLRGRTSDLLSNPFSMDPATVNAIMGRNTDAINQRTNRLSQQAADRAASSGLRSDSGTVLNQQSAIQQTGANQVSNAERDVQIQAAIQNQQDMRSALGAASGAIGEDLGRRERLSRDAALGVLGESSIQGDAFLTNAMLAANNPGNQYNVNAFGQGMRYGGPGASPTVGYY